MRHIGDAIEAAGASAIARFRHVHGVALVINLVRLMVVVWGGMHLSIQLKQPMSTSSQSARVDQAPPAAA